MIEMIIHLLLLGFVIFLLAELMPGVHVESYGTAVLVAVVYGIISVTLGSILKFLFFPVTFLTLGFFLLIINSFLLWLTDKLMDSFEIDGAITTFVMAVLITLTERTLTYFI